MNASPRDESGWTIETYSAHNEALRMAEEKFQTERDRRYQEVDRARDEALRIKEDADREALRLARAAQDYRDERDNRLREQIEQERGNYATQTELGEAISRFERSLSAFREQYEAAHKPLADYVTAQIGRSEGIGASTAVFYAALTIAVAIVVAVILYTH